LKSLQRIYSRLYKKFGQQHWWPGETKFEIIIGAILTQNTNWGNVEKALSNLKKNRLLAPKSLKGITEKRLAGLIKPAGYFNVKARRVKNFMFFLFDEYQGSLAKMGRESTEGLREKLLSVNGVGPETADSILLYAFNKPIFVVDAYTKRIFSRHKIISPDSDYNSIQNKFMQNLKNDVKMFNEYHALIVRLGKEFCKTKPKCNTCPLDDLDHG